MKNLISGTTNNVVFTLHEKCLLTANTSYLFSLHGVENDRDYLFLATDVSLFPANYSEFNITITGSTVEILSASTICLPAQEYNYDIYETTATTIAISATTQNIVETGLMRVWPSEPYLPITYYSGATLNKTVYLN